MGRGGGGGIGKNYTVNRILSMENKMLLIISKNHIWNSRFIYFFKAWPQMFCRLKRYKINS